jgi:hypothetical protein
MSRCWRPSERSKPAIVLALICCSPALAQSVSPDGSVISNDAGTLVTAAGTWSFGGPAPGRPGEWLILLNGSASNGGISASLEVANDGQIYALTASGSWWIWNGRWTQTSAPLPPPQVGVLQVGPGRTYQTISAAVSVANADTDLTHNYDIQVLPGTYTNDFPAALTRPMTIEVDPCCTGQEVVLNATVDLPNQKGILLSLSSLTVNGLTFEGAHISAALGGNGAGIRDQSEDPAAMLIIQNSVFTNNQEGVLTGDNANQVIMVSNSSFINNGNPDPSVFQHGIYVNAGAMFSVSNSLFCGQLIGHSVKSRAAVTMVSDSQIYDGAQGPTAQGCLPGSSSFAIDVANGGAATITGNQLIQGASTQNYKIVDYGEEGLIYSSNSLVVSGNAFVSMGTPSATAVYDPNCVLAQLSNNTSTGITTVLDPANCAAP